MQTKSAINKHPFEKTANPRFCKKKREMYGKVADKVCLVTTLKCRQSLHINIPHSFVCLSCFASFWGKFGERNNKPQTHVIQSAHQLYCPLNNPSYHISTVRICTEDIMEVVTTRTEEEVEQNVKTNIFIAKYTTTHARLKLYSALETLQERVLYYDTDSVIYKWRPGQVEIRLGVFFGRFY